MVTKHGDLHARIKADILGGKYGDAQALPSEIALVRRFGVSRTTVQRALRDLEREGLVEKVQRKGSFVVPSARRDRTVGVILPESVGKADETAILKAVGAAVRKRGFSVVRIRKGR